jgi:hypothetical protein
MIVNNMTEKNRYESIGGRRRETSLMSSRMTPEMNDEAADEGA